MQLYLLELCIGDFFVSIENRLNINLEKTSTLLHLLLYLFLHILCLELLYCK